MKMNKIATTALAASLSVLIVGCATSGEAVKPKAWHEEDIEAKITDYRDQMKNDNVINTKDDYFVEPLSVDLSEEHPWLRSEVDVKSTDVPFERLVGNLLKNAKAPVRATYAMDMDASTKVTVDYQGDTEGALNYLARLSGYRYVIEGDNVRWYHRITKTFDLSIAPGEEKFTMGMGGSTQQQSSSTVGQIATTGGVNTNNQSVSRSSSGSIWADVDATVKGLLTEKGFYKVSQSSGTLTVTDAADRVEQVERYVRELNSNLTKQVLLKFQLLEINLNDNYQYGIDWNAIKTNASGNSLTLTGGLAATALSGITSHVIGVEINDPNNPWAGSTALINALGLQGNVKVMTQPEIVTVNGRVGAVNVGRQTTYLASASSTSTANVGSTTGATPGVVEDGLNMYVLPKILDTGKVVLTMSANIANLESIDLVTSGEGESASSIQTPKLSKRDFMQTVALRSGETIMLSGFRTQRETDDQNSFLGIPFLGGVRGGTNRTELLLIITPIILDAGV